MPQAMTGTSARRISASHHAGAAAERGPAVAELPALHGLSLTAVGNGVDAEVRADAVDVHQEVARVGGDPAVAIESAEPAVVDLVDLARGDPEVLAALGDRGNAVARDEIAVVHLAQQLAGVARVARENRGGHPDQWDQ